MLPWGCGKIHWPRGGHMGRVFESWIGQPVTVHLAVGQIRLSLRGTLLQEQKETLLMRLQHGPDLEICKTELLAIEEVDSSSRS